MAEFERKSLGEVLGERGYIRGPFGSALVRNELEGDGIPVYEQQHAITGTREFRFFVNEEKFKELSRFQVKPNDLIISCSGTVGSISVIQPEDPMGIISQALLILRPHSRDVLPEFLYYFLSTREGQHALVQASHGSVQVNIAPRAVVERIELPVPSLPEQSAITHILGTLDDKIELNRLTDETLEAMARALFKSWFVDFDPVRAKAEGRDSGLPKPLADLFPDSFEDSALGEIPRGWPARPLKEVLNEVNERVGGADMPEYSSTNDGLQLRSERFTKKLSVSNANNKVIRRGCLVFGLSRRVLNFGLMRDDIGSVSPAYRVLAVDHASIVPDLLEQMMRMRPAYFYNAVSASSREGQSVSLEGLGVLCFVQPNKAAQEAYYRVTDSLCRRARSLENESRTLTALRDALLPKLISGELRVKDAEGFIGRMTP